MVFEYRKVYILARDIDAAKKIAKKNKNLYLGSGKWVSSTPIKEGNLKTYSFQRKDI